MRDAVLSDRDELAVDYGVALHALQRFSDLRIAAADDLAIAAVERNPAPPDFRDHPEAVVFVLENPAGIVERRVGERREHWLQALGQGRRPAHEKPILKSALRNAWKSFKDKGTLRGSIMFRRRCGVRDIDDRSGWADQADGQETKNLSNFPGLLRSGDRRSVDESGSGSVGGGQQSLPPGRGKGEPRPGRYRGDHGKARRCSQATGWNRPTF